VGNDDDAASLKLSVYMTEYNRAWAEIFARFESQRLAITVLIAGFGALVSLEKLAGYLTELAAWMPLFASALGYVFFDNELQIWRIARYMRDVLAPDVRRVTDDAQALRLDESKLPPTTGTIAFALSIGRWLLFILPAVCAIVAGWPVFFRHGWWGVALLGLDLVATALLVLGIAAAINEQQRWRTRPRKPVGAKP
jgi:hypothetical protein